MSTKDLVEGIDFYYSTRGLMIFTEQYHLKRGYCCKSGCRHCPYNPKDEPTIKDNRENRFFRLQTEE